MNEPMLEAYAKMADAFHTLTTAVVVEGVVWAYKYQPTDEKYEFQSYDGKISVMIVDHDRAALATLETWGGDQFTQEPDGPNESANGHAPYNRRTVGEAIYRFARRSLDKRTSKKGGPSVPRLAPATYIDERGLISTLVVDPETSSFTAWPDCRLLKISKSDDGQLVEEVIEGRVPDYNES